MLCCVMLCYIPCHAITSHHMPSHHKLHPIPSHPITSHKSQVTSHKSQVTSHITHLIISIQIGHLDLQPKQPTIAQRLLLREAQQASTQIVSHVIQMRGNGVHTSTEIKIHRKEHGLLGISHSFTNIILELTGNVQFVAQITTQRMQIAVLLLDLHQFFSIFLIVRKIGLFLEFQKK